MTALAWGQPDGGVTQLATRDLPGMIELVERTPAQEEVYAAIHRASVGWDGSDPIRRTDR